MVFNSTGFVVGIFVGLVIWLGILSVLLVRMISHYNRLSKGVTKAGLTDALDGILRSVHGLQGRVTTMEHEVESLTRDGELHVQRVGIVRFNPFADTGGSQSLSIALLDAQGSGIVMTSLYARAGNRWYVKEVTHGKGAGVALSKEEESAIDQAKHGRKKTHE